MDLSVKPAAQLPWNAQTLVQLQDQAAVIVTAFGQRQTATQISIIDRKFQNDQIRGFGNDHIYLVQAPSRCGPPCAMRKARKGCLRHVSSRAATRSGQGSPAVRLVPMKTIVTGPSLRRTTAGSCLSATAFCGGDRTYRLQTPAIRAMTSTTRQRNFT